MRGLFGFYSGGSWRNKLVKLEDPHPVADHGQRLDTGNAGLDGYTVMNRTAPDAPGYPPVVKGVVGNVYPGPDMDFD